MFDVMVFAVVVFVAFDGGDVVVVFFGEDFTVVDGLDDGLVVGVVDFAVDGGGAVGGLLVVDLFVLYGCVNALFNGGVVVAVLVENSTDGFLCSLHF